jgi:5-methylcytosine-specific restriction endonuclease McrA
VCDGALSTEVDHIDDPHDHGEKNLQGICSPCHKDKTQREAADARRTTRR